MRDKLTIRPLSEAELRKRAAVLNTEADHASDPAKSASLRHAAACLSVKANKARGKRHA